MICTVRFRRTELSHSSKGSSWKDHKYIRKEGNKYIYADSPENSSDQENKNQTSTEEVKENTDKQKTDENNKESFDLEEMANKVIRGEFGNGADRKELLGDSYAEIQKRVNEILKGSGSQTSVSKSSVEKGKSAASSLLDSSTEYQYKSGGKGFAKKKTK